MFFAVVFLLQLQRLGYNVAIKTKWLIDFVCFSTGVIARHPSYIPFIRNALTEENVEKFFEHLWETKPKAGECRVKRFVLLLIGRYDLILAFKCVNGMVLEYLPS